MQRGFSIIEFAIVAGVVALLAVSVNIFTRSLQRTNDLSSTTLSVAQALHAARAEALAVDGDSAWGVSVQAGKAVVFKGSTYATRTAFSDRFYQLASSVTPTGTTEFDFTKFSATTTTGTTTLVIASPAATSSIVVSAQGIINY